MKKSVNIHRSELLGRILSLKGAIFMLELFFNSTEYKVLLEQLSRLNVEIENVEYELRNIDHNSIIQHSLINVARDSIIYAKDISSRVSSNMTSKIRLCEQVINEN